MPPVTRTGLFLNVHFRPIAAGIPSCPRHHERGFPHSGHAMSLFLTAIGLMMIFEGIPYFCFPNQVKALAQKIPELDNGILRGLGIVIIILGLVVVYFGRLMYSNE